MVKKRMARKNGLNSNSGSKKIFLVIGLLVIIFILAVGTYLSLSGEFGSFWGKKASASHNSQATISLTIEKSGPAYNKSVDSQNEVEQ